jgi:hypothetical protein
VETKNVGTAAPIWVAVYVIRAFWLPSSKPPLALFLHFCGPGITISHSFKRSHCFLAAAARLWSSSAARALEFSSLSPLHPLVVPNTGEERTEIEPHPSRQDCSPDCLATIIAKTCTSHARFIVGKSLTTSAAIVFPWDGATHIDSRTTS